MKRTTLKLITVLFLTLLLSFTALLLVFRHVMSNHIETNASQAIEYVKEELSDPELYYDDDALFEWEQTHEMPSTVASCLLVGKTYKTQSYELARRRELAKWCSRHGAPDGTTQSVSLGGRAYFVSQIPNTTEEGNGEGIWIIYVDVTGENALIRRMDLDMILVMVLCAALACVCGIRIGVSIERGQERQKKFFENASHELKTPLMSIQGYAEGICSGVIQDEKHAASVIMSESDKMTALVDEILCLSRFESGETRLHLESVSVPGRRQQLPRLARVGDRQEGALGRDASLGGGGGAGGRRKSRDGVHKPAVQRGQVRAEQHRDRLRQPEPLRLERRGEALEGGRRAHLRAVLHRQKRQHRHRPRAHEGDHRAPRLAAAAPQPRGRPGVRH
jgi:hypothetical protein